MIIQVDKVTIQVDDDLIQSTGKPKEGIRALILSMAKQIETVLKAPDLLGVYCVNQIQVDLNMIMAIDKKEKGEESNGKTI